MNRQSRGAPNSVLPPFQREVESLQTVQTKGLGRTKFVAEGNRRIVHRVEDQLIQSRKFSLPGKKLLSSTETEWSVMPTQSVPVVEDDTWRDGSLPGLFNSKKR